MKKLWTAFAWVLFGLLLYIVMEGVRLPAVGDCLRGRGIVGLVMAMIHGGQGV